MCIRDRFIEKSKHDVIKDKTSNAFIDTPVAEVLPPPLHVKNYIYEMFTWATALAAPAVTEAAVLM